MYKQPHFTETDDAAVWAFMKAHPFVTLIGNDAGKNVATQVPVLFEKNNGSFRLRGHIMRKTDHHKAFEKNDQVLVLFTGPHCYISASWYSERGMGSSWNYISVHAQGSIKLFGDEETLNILTDLTHKFEDERAHPELVENMTQHYLQSHVKAITGFEITVQSLYPIFKLSQNRDDESYKNIVMHLGKNGHADAKQIAAEMIMRRKHLFDDAV